MFEIAIPINEFLDRAIAASESSDYLAFIAIIARSAEGQFLQDELLRHWESFDDLTGEEILVLSPKSHEDGSAASVRHWREPEGLVNNRLGFGSQPTHNWAHAFWEARPVKRSERRRAYEDFGGVYSPRRPLNEAEKKAAITASATEMARYFGVRESWLPCVVMLSLLDRKGVVVTAKQGFSLYAVVRAALMDYEPIVSARENRKKRVAEIIEEGRRKEEEIGKVRSEVDKEKKLAGVAGSWTEQIQAAIRMLKAVAECSPDSRDFADLLVRWLNDEIEQPPDLETCLESWFLPITNGIRREIPEYLAQRRQRLPKTIERKKLGYLSGTMAQVRRCRAEINELEVEKSHLLLEISELRRSHPIFESFVNAVVKECYIEDSVSVQQHGALRGWAVHHFVMKESGEQKKSADKNDVALSFAGEDRQAAREIANGLRASGVAVFYDEFEKARLWGVNLIDYLTSVYFERARFCMMLISQAYVRKLWTSVERQAMQAGALVSKIEAILPVRLDDVEVPGFLPTVGYLDLRQEGTEAIVEATVARVRG